MIGHEFTAQQSQHHLLPIDEYPLMGQLVCILASGLYSLTQLGAMDVLSDTELLESSSQLVLEAAMGALEGKQHKKGTYYGFSQGCIYQYYGLYSVCPPFGLGCAGKCKREHGENVKKVTLMEYTMAVQRTFPYTKILRTCVETPIEDFINRFLIGVHSDRVLLV
ncbi:hypothetical protein M9H77_06890 [Catharanthus roseus]|uniref:Uncharacterized protein n=1 Tax=Catharanthus roseus TaxID=4058 RepID=A0ACC0BTE9_CATRO|nr:hypothetical protein M9H77_06890 [Catharanthus roseus]